VNTLQFTILPKLSTQTALFSNLSHYIRMSRQILFGGTTLPYNRLQILTTYYSLILKSFLQHRLSRGADLPDNVTGVLGYSVTYSSLPVLINLFEEIFIEGSYAFKTTAPGPVIIDCGSNVGLSVLYFKMIYPNSVITAFEPDATSFSLLERNVRENYLQQVTVINAALSDETGEQFLYTPSQKNSSLNPTLIPSEDQAASTLVKVECLSSYITGPVDCLKIDIEGSEINVLEELIWSRKHELVKLMVVEFHHEQVPASLADFVRMIETEGMKVSVRKGSARETLLVCERK